MTPQPDPNALEKVRRRLVVSCQAYPGEPMRSASIMGAVAESAIIGGAQGIRAQGLEDLRTIRALTPLPLIGLVKRGDDGVFITPTLQDSLDCIAAGSDIVALDGTRRPRPDGHDLAENITAIHDAGALAMADCGSLADAEYALGAGADCIGTTLAGYTGERPPTEGPDFALISELVREIAAPIIAEGRIRHPDDAAACLDLGVYTVVVGTAITHPARITKTFVQRFPAA